LQPVVVLDAGDPRLRRAPMVLAQVVASSRFVNACVYRAARGLAMSTDWLR
jgi:hypothetical protein